MINLTDSIKFQGFDNFLVDFKKYNIIINLHIKYKKVQKLKSNL